MLMGVILVEKICSLRTYLSHKVLDKKQEIDPVIRIKLQFSYRGQWKKSSLKRGVETVQ